MPFSNSECGITLVPVNVLRCLTPITLAVGLVPSGEFQITVCGVNFLMRRARQFDFLFQQAVDKLADVLAAFLCRMGNPRANLGFEINWQIQPRVGTMKLPPDGFGEIIFFFHVSRF